MNDLWTFEITDDSGLMALVDPDEYASFLGEDFTFDDFKRHCVSEMSRHRMLIWGTGAEATWNVELRLSQDAPAGFREIVGGIRSSRGRLALVNYEDLSMAAMYADERLPLPHAPHAIQLPAGEYECRIVQLQPPEEHDEESGNADFVMVLNNKPTLKAWNTIPWFE